jgi:hypothetical protein
MTDWKAMPIEARLNNWSRGVRLGGVGRGGRSIASAEGMYRANGEGAQEARRAPPPSRPDIDDAWRVEYAWRTLCGPLDKRYGLMLRFHYVWRLDPVKCVRRIYAEGGGRVRDYQATLGAAHGRIADALERDERVNESIVRRTVRRMLEFVHPAT